jgi:hypothetical protein
VKSADKGGAIVIWPRESYIAETNKQLNDKRNYKLIETDPFSQLVTKLNKIVKTFFIDQLIVFYLLINQLGSLHYIYCFLKYTNLTYQLMISGYEGPTVGLSAEYVDVYLKLLVQYIPSYIKDFPNLIKRIFKLNETLYQMTLY